MRETVGIEIDFVLDFVLELVSFRLIITLGIDNTIQITRGPEGDAEAGLNYTKELKQCVEKKLRESGLEVNSPFNDYTLVLNSPAKEIVIALMK